VVANVDPGGTVHLGWTMGAPGETYRVYERDVSFGQTYATRYPLTFTGSSASLSLLRDGHQYEFSVASGDGPPSPPVAVSVHVGRPPPPIGLTATPDTTAAVVLRWAPERYAVGYSVLQRDLTAGETTPHLLELSNPYRTIATTGSLLQDHTYEFSVVATNGAGASPPSTAVVAQAHAIPPPAPSALRAKASADGRVRLSWHPAGPTGAVPGPSWARVIEPATLPPSFAIFQRDMTAGEADFTRWAYPVPATEIDADALHSGHTYLFSVAATGPGGDGPLAAPVMVSVTGGIPAMVAQLSAAAADARVSLVWSAVGGSDIAYRVYRRDLTVGEIDFTPMPLPVVGDRFTDQSVYNGHVYEYRVAAANAHGEGPPSAAALAQPVPPPPGPPTGLAAQSGNATVTLTWTAPPGDVYFFVYRRDASRDEPFRRLPLPVVTGATFSDGSLTNGDTYEYKVSATNVGGEGPTSAVVSIRPGG
jgi:hypothetical protein